MGDEGSVVLLAGAVEAGLDDAAAQGVEVGHEELLEFAVEEAALLSRAFYLLLP